MYRHMTQALRESDQNDAIRCIMIAGAPGAFCAGNDIADFPTPRAAGSRSARRTSFSTRWRAAKPLVAAVNGVAIGIGTTMLLHCDHVVAGSGAILSTPFIKLGLIPEAASTLLAPMRMGYARAFSLLVMGRPLSAAEAKDAGIVNTVVDRAEVDDVRSARARDRRASAPAPSPWRAD